MTTTPQYGKIFKQHPMPPRTTSPKKKYNFDGMEIGDAILLPSSASGCASWLWESRGWKMARRAVDDASIMLWRIE